MDWIVGIYFRLPQDAIDTFTLQTINTQRFITVKRKLAMKYIPQYNGLKKQLKNRLTNSDINDMIIISKRGY